MTAVDTERVTFSGTVKRGHGVASGVAGDSRYPAGTLRLQMPHFKALGLDLRSCFPGTINLDIAPLRLMMEHPDHRFVALQWSPHIPAETFSFCACRIEYAGTRVAGWIYYPHPETKPEHFQNPSTVELLAPKLEGIQCGDRLTVSVAAGRIRLVE